MFAVSNMTWLFNYNPSIYAEGYIVFVFPFVSFFIRSFVIPSHSVFCVLCLCWGLTSQSTFFQSCRDGATASWVINQYFRGVTCLAQGHNTAAVGFEPPTSRSGVRHSTTEPPRYPCPIQWKFTSKFYVKVSQVGYISPTTHQKAFLFRP